jgi:carboxyl-terminal processing protease
MAARGVAWIRIDEFGGATGADLVQALRRLDGKTPPNGVVLDLRNNPGGMVPAGVAVAGAFLPRGAVLFSARGREAGAVATVTVDPVYYQLPGEPDVLAGLPAWTRTVPLTVLVNGASASAAELVAGALQDNRRATIIGTRTFGKGSIQSVIPLTADSGIKFTVARYFTPNGHEIQTHGVVPDIPVMPTAATGNALLPREADLPNHLPPTGPDAAASGHAPAESTRMFGTRDDKALRTAINLLKPADGRGATLAGLLRKLVARLKGNPGATTAVADAQ